MKNLVKLFWIGTLITSSINVFAQSNDTLATSVKIDSIYTLQKKMYSETKNSPLSNKKIGIELNLVRILLSEEATTISGTFSLFNVNRHSEIAFPFYIQNGKRSYNLSEFTFDCHYRHFLGNTQNGFYLSGFARYAFLKGSLGTDYFLMSNSPAKIGTENKLGIGFGLGYRIFSYRGLYWGTSFSIGRYLVGENDKFSSGIFSFDDDNEYIFDIEILKFGWSF